MHAQGYKTEFVAVAMYREESLLGIYERFEKQHLNPALNPRFVSEAYHEDALSGFTANFIQDADKFDRSRVVNRDGQTLFESEARGKSSLTAYKALLKGRELTTARADALVQGWMRVKELAERRGAPEAYKKCVEEHMRCVRDLTNEIQEGQWARDVIAETFRQEPPEKALQRHPELASAFGLARACEAKAEADGLTSAQRAVVMVRVRENVASSIERGDAPKVQIREEKKIEREKSHEPER
jgi:hypothetical protein